MFSAMVSFEKKDMLMLTFMFPKAEVQPVELVVRWWSGPVFLSLLEPLVMRILAAGTIHLPCSRLQLAFIFAVPSESNKRLFWAGGYPGNPAKAKQFGR